MVLIELFILNNVQVLFGIKYYPYRDITLIGYSKESKLFVDDVNDINPIKLRLSKNDKSIDEVVNLGSAETIWKLITQAEPLPTAARNVSWCTLRGSQRVVSGHEVISCWTMSCR